MIFGFLCIGLAIINHESGGPLAPSVLCLLMALCSFIYTLAVIRND